MKIKLDNKKIFWTKVALLATFTLAYLPLAELKQNTTWQVYLAILIAIHIYFFAVLFAKVTWRNLGDSKTKLFARIAMVAVLSLALIALGRSPLRQEIVTFLSISFVLHVMLVSALHLKSLQVKSTYHKSPVKS